MQVAELMTKDVKACGLEDTLDKAAQIFWDCDCGFAPVVDERGRAVGVITDRDACMAAYTQGKQLSEIPVTAVMSTTVYSCNADAPISAAATLMGENRVRRLPVVDSDSGRLVGVLSINDIAVQSARERGARHREISEKQVADTLAAVSMPRHPKPEQIQALMEKAV
jgi:CBS-domain-containing membrane protein